LLGIPDQEALQQRLGPNFEMLIDLPLNPFTGSSNFLIEEMDVYFRQLQGREKSIVETSLLPVLSQILGLEFEPLQEWGESEDDRVSRILAEQEAALQKPEPKSFLQKLFHRT
jgi:hypothetical protein